MNLQRIHHVAIICSDYETSKRFYTQILGLAILHENFQSHRGSYKLDLALPDGGQLELFYIPGAPPRNSYPEALGLRHLAFTVADVNAASAELLTMGITVEPVRQDPYTGRSFAFFADPDGLPIELYEAE